ncbi:uncharacterized protein LOC123672824 isoform X1 [Harmonia axyridis]|uniref:uncharacterized protein LOC123672824 isoform X1 n=2 Tax=Harmonia axyridis TaxID=115357 RepID=UPI001E279CD8|nr:uncharacterized protein LOC123672824 isoform X1 [Harmonia axyridis]
MTSEMQSNSLTFEKALRIVSPSINSSDLYKLLTFIRKSVEWPKHRKNIIKIHKSGCIKTFLACLNHDGNKIIAVSLSILGNCCLESNCSNEVAFKGLNDLHNLLQRCSKDDSVNGRIFRIIGNICQHNISSFILKSKSHVFTYILKFIQKYVDDDDNKVSEATIMMAVRAVSKFMDRQTYITLVDKYEMLKPIGALFIKRSTRWTSEKKEEAVLKNIITFLYQFSKYKYGAGITQLRTTSEGDCLMYFHQILPLAPQTIVNTVMNFISVSTLKSDIPVKDITAGFVKLLKNASVNKDEIKNEHKDYIKCLCFLLDDPINRDPNRCDDTIPQLIRTLDDVENPSNDVIEILCLILETFERCNYHQNIMKQQLQNNMIEVLVRKLENLLGSRKYLKMKHVLVKKKKKKVKSTMCNEKPFWDSLPSSSDEEMDTSINRLPPFRPSSPGSGSDSEMFISPWSSPRAPTPPAESTTFYLQESDSEDYSPVCSENESEDEPMPNVIHSEIEDFTETEKNSDSDNIQESVEKISEEDLKYRLIHHSLSLLKAYSFIQPLPSQLCSDALLMILVKCACYFESTSRATHIAKSVIVKILSVHDHLIPLMQTGVISAVFSLRKTDHGSDCETCFHFESIGDQVLEKFTELIESGCGRGDIANRLICGNEVLKRQLVMAIPYIVKCRTILYTFMVSCKGLKILINCLKDEETLRRKCLKVICVLASKHSNMLGRCTFSPTKEKIFIGNYEISENCKNVVTFVLDDDSRLCADRDVLCEKSPYFNALLSGSFKESNEEHVKLQDTNYSSLKCLIYLLNCDLDMSKPKDIQLETDTILDMIILCHRYLLEELCLYLTLCVKQFCLSPENLVTIYKWSLESNTNILRTESLTYALNGAARVCDVINMFMKLFDLGFMEILVEDIETLILSNITWDYFNR